AELARERENRVYLPQVELPAHLRIDPAPSSQERADDLFLAVPSRALLDVIQTLRGGALGHRTAVVSVAKGLVPPQGLPPTTILAEAFGADRVACVGGP